MIRKAVHLVSLLMVVFFTAVAETPLPREVEPLYPVPEEIQRVLDIAREELGYQERSDGVTKYGTWAGDPKAQWCAEYLCWVVDQADQRFGYGLLKSQYPLYGASNTGRDWFLQQGRYIARNGFVPDWGSQWFKGQATTMGKNAYVPQPGDWVFFSYGSSGDTSHVAMVEKSVQMPDGSLAIQVLEGNNPQAVARATYPLSDWRIQGYGTVRDLADIVLRMGARGEKVRALQEILAEVGLLDAGSISGFYDQRTSDAVKGYQATMQATQTGIANQATQLSLQEYLITWRASQVGYFTVEDGL